MSPSNANMCRARPLRDTLDKGALLPVGKIVCRRLLAAAFDGETSLHEVVLPMPEFELLPGAGTGILVRYITRKSEFDPCNPLYDNDNLVQVRVLYPKAAVRMTHPGELALLLLTRIISISILRCCCW